MATSTPEFGNCVTGLSSYLHVFIFFMPLNDDQKQTEKSTFRSVKVNIP